MKALEQALRERPEDEDAWRVYADWLLEQGDVRGEVIRLGDQLRRGEIEDPYEVESRYAALCRQARWPKDGPWPQMCWRARFECLIFELLDHGGFRFGANHIGPPTPPEELERWRRVAGPAWPEGMSELYAQLSSVDIDFEGLGTKGSIRLPPLSRIWDHAGLRDSLWFDSTGPDHPFQRVRPIDKFVPEAFTVLYPVPSDRPAGVAYHYCGEELILSELTYREWLELLMRSRGALYWVHVTVDPRRERERVGEEVYRMAEIFPDFELESMLATRPGRKVYP